MQTCWMHSHTLANKIMSEFTYILDDTISLETHNYTNAHSIKLKSRVYGHWPETRGGRGRVGRYYLKLAGIHGRTGQEY